MRLSKAVFVVVLGVLAVFGCSSEPSPGPSPDQAVGTLGLPLVSEEGGVTYRLVGTILIRSRSTGAIEATVNASADGPSLQSVSLVPGGYTLEVVDGYSCTVEPADESFTGCTYTGSSPDPFVIGAAQTSEVWLNLTFHFGSDVEVVLRTGDTTLALAPAVERPCPDGCADGELCVAFDGGEPACALECTTDDDCGFQQACFAGGDGETRVCSSLVTRLWSTLVRTTEIDTVTDIASDSEGNVFVAGQTLGVFPGKDDVEFGSAGFLRKLDGNGNELWTKVFDVANGYVKVAVDGSDNVLVGGPIEKGMVAETDGFVLKLDGDGHEIWARAVASQLGEPVPNDVVHALATDGSDNVFVGGTTQGAFPGYANPGPDSNGFIRKLDGEGSEIWTRQFGELIEVVRSIAVDELGNLFIAGYATSSSGHAFATVQKLDSDGNAVWTWTHGSGEAPAYGNSVATDGTGGVLVTGSAMGSGVVTQPDLATWDAFVTKLDGDGNAIWTQQFRSSVSNNGLSVASDGGGNAFVAVSAGTDFVSKLNANGDMIWTEPLESTLLVAVCADPDGNAFAAGYQNNIGSSYDGVVVKLGL